MTNTPRTWEGDYEVSKYNFRHYGMSDSDCENADKAIKAFICTIEDEAVRRTESVTLLKMSEKTGLDKDIIKLTAKHLKQILDMSSDKHLREWIADYINLLNNN